MYCVNCSLYNPSEPKVCPVFEDFGVIYSNLFLGCKIPPNVEYQAMAQKRNKAINAWIKQEKIDREILIGLLKDIVEFDELKQYSREGVFFFHSGGEHIFMDSDVLEASTKAPYPLCDGIEDEGVTGYRITAAGLDWLSASINCVIWPHDWPTFKSENGFDSPARSSHFLPPEAILESPNLSREEKQDIMRRREHRKEWVPTGRRPGRPNTVYPEPKVSMVSKTEKPGVEKPRKTIKDLEWISIEKKRAEKRLRNANARRQQTQRKARARKGV